MDVWLALYGISVLASPCFAGIHRDAVLSRWAEQYLHSTGQVNKGYTNVCVTDREYWVFEHGKQNTNYGNNLAVPQSGPKVIYPVSKMHTKIRCELPYCWLNLKQDRRFTCNVIMWRFRLTVFCNGEVTIRCVYSVELSATPNNIKILSVSRQRSYGEFLLLVEVKCS
jgi:hypothetical protein